MIPVPSGVRFWVATGATDMRRGMNGLALQVQQALQRDPHAGDLYIFSRLLKKPAGEVLFLVREREFQSSRAFSACFRASAFPRRRLEALRGQTQPVVSNRGNRTRLQAAALNWNAQPMRGRPRKGARCIPPMVLIQPFASSIRLRIT